MQSDFPFEEGDTHDMVSTVIKFTTNQSLVLGNMKCFFSASSIGVSVHLEQDALFVIFLVKDDLANKVFFFLHNDIDFADVSLLLNIEELIAWIRGACSTI